MKKNTEYRIQNSELVLQKNQLNSDDWWLDSFSIRSLDKQNLGAVDSHGIRGSRFCPDVDRLEEIGVPEFVCLHMLNRLWRLV